MAVGSKSEGWWVDWVTYTDRVHRQHRSECPNCGRFQKSSEHPEVPGPVGLVLVVPLSIWFQFVVPETFLSTLWGGVWSCSLSLVGGMTEICGRVSLRKNKNFSDQVNFGNDTCLQITLLPILWEVMWFKNIQILILLNPMFSKIPDYKARWGIMVSTEPWMENITPNVFILGVKKLSSWYTSLHHSNPHN